MLPRQPYAPTPHSYVPSSHLHATISLDEEVKLADTRAERDLQDSLAEIFSILVTLDELEKAFLKDAIPEADYTEICERALKQYRSLLADETVAKAFKGLDEFKAEWGVRVFFFFFCFLMFSLALRLLLLCRMSSVYTWLDQLT
jgi:ESCRT-I complex subunit VPS28